MMIADKNRHSKVLKWINVHEFDECLRINKDKTTELYTYAWAPTAINWKSEQVVSSEGSPHTPGFAPLQQVKSGLRLEIFYFCLINQEIRESNQIRHLTKFYSRKKDLLFYQTCTTWLRNRSPMHLRTQIPPIFPQPHAI